MNGLIASRKQVRVMPKDKRRITYMCTIGLTLYYQSETDGFNNGIELIKCPVVSIDYVEINGVIKDFNVSVINARAVNACNRITMRADKVIGGALVFWIDFATGDRGLDFNSLVARLKNRSLAMNHYSLSSKGGEHE